ncbi:hypothetical protein Tco_0285683 [Tanacetum coccineum]
MDGHAVAGELNASVEEKYSLAQVWHKRLGHIGEVGLQVLEKQGLFGKKSLVIDYVHSDLWGPSQVKSLGGKSRGSASSNQGCRLLNPTQKIVVVIETTRNLEIWQQYNLVKLSDGSMKAHCKHCEQQDERNNTWYDTNAEGALTNEVVSDADSADVRPSYERDTSTEVQHSNNDEYDNVFAFDNVFAHERQHHEQPESINDTYVEDHDDSNIIFETSYIDPNRGEEEHDNVDYEQECKRKEFEIDLKRKEKLKLAYFEAIHREKLLKTKFDEHEKTQADECAKQLKVEQDRILSLEQRIWAYKEREEFFKPLLKRKEDVEIGYAEAIIREKKSKANFEKEISEYFKKIQNLTKEISKIKFENSKLQITTSKFEITKTNHAMVASKLEDENQELLK